MASQLTLVLMLLLVAAVAAQKRGSGSRTSSRTSTSSSNSNTDEWNYRDGSDKVNMRGVANLTEVLDNWKFDIMGQMKNLLQNDHQSLLPDYARIQPLSEVVDDLFKEFNALKAHLGELTEKFTAVETFIDELKAQQTQPASAPAAPASPAAAAPLPRQPGRRLIKKKAPPS